VISIKNDYWAATDAGPHFQDQLLGLQFTELVHMIGIVLGYILYKIADLPISKSAKPAM